MKTILLRLLILATLTFSGNYLFSQNLRGVVYEQNQADKQALPGVNVYWSGTTVGVATNPDGVFELSSRGRIDNQLVFSFVGYSNDTIAVGEKENDLEIVLSTNKQLKAVEIITRASGTSIKRFDPLTVQNISGAELHKAACCNLGESFETNASVDVHYSDAVTGAKQIQLLGLAGVYSQMMTENIPNMYGLATTYGLGYIPGSWMESIQVSKGAASVLDGYSSVTGQINTNTKNPANSEKLYFNALTNSVGKYEANLTSAIKLNEKWSTIILLHGENASVANDENDDGFLDMPLVRQYNVMNKWKYFGQKGFMAQAGIKYIDESRQGGQVAFNPENVPANSAYGIGIDTRRVEGFFKFGYELPSNPDMNMALKMNASLHEQNSFFGINEYIATEKSFYANYIFQNLIAGSEEHKYSTGMSFLYDDYHEDFNDSLFLKTEIVPGAFFQYTFHKGKLPIVILGMRADYHNLYGMFYTPRVHVRYSFNEKNVLRASAGKGYRTANVFSENSYLFASSRSIKVLEDLKMEEAWNYGVNFTHYHDIAGRELVVNTELYRSDFTNQVIIDMDQDVSSVLIYNLNGESYSNVFQVEAKYELIKGMDVLLAYRWQDVKYTSQNVLIEKPLVTKYKGLFNVSYATNLQKWQFDYTLVVNGDQRLPSTIQNPLEYQRPDMAPAYAIMNSQVTKYFRYWNIYLGVENLTGYTQDNPIIAADDPFSDYFDASMVWGPLAGRKFYVGIRIIPFYK